jgi:hypothetical protein
MYEALSDGGSVERERRAGLRDESLHFLNIVILFRAPEEKGNVCSCGFFYEHKENARAPRTNKRRLNPSPRQCYSTCWQMRHTLGAHE